MGSFSVWHWIIVLVFVGVIVWLVRTARNMRPNDKSELQGIGGWLAWLAISQVLGVIRLTLSSIANFEGYGPVMGLPNGRVAVYTEVAMNVALVALAIATTVALFKKRRAFVRLFTYQWLAVPLVFVLNLLIVSASFNLPVSELVGPEDFRTTFATVIAAGIWVWYTRVSVRVRNTMVN